VHTNITSDRRRDINDPTTFIIYETPASTGATPPLSMQSLLVAEVEEATETETLTIKSEDPTRVKNAPEKQREVVLSALA
jgi:hypothetical protein